MITIGTTCENTTCKHKWYQVYLIPIVENLIPLERFLKGNSTCGKSMISYRRDTTCKGGYYMEEVDIIGEELD